MSDSSTRFQKTHGMAGTPEHKAWKRMKDRCNNTRCQDWPDYGGRGIEVHGQWQADFQSFYDHIGARPTTKHSLDRINNNGNYEPGNVRWATPSQQQSNKRSNRMVVLEGKRMTVAAASRATGIPDKTIYRRLDLGWDPARAASAPVDPEGGRFKKGQSSH